MGMHFCSSHHATVSTVILRLEDQPSCIATANGCDWSKAKALSLLFTCRMTHALGAQSSCRWRWGDPLCRTIPPSSQRERPLPELRVQAHQVPPPLLPPKAPSSFKWHLQPCPVYKTFMKSDKALQALHTAAVPFYLTVSEGHGSLEVGVFCLSSMLAAFCTCLSSMLAAFRTCLSSMLAAFCICSALLSPSPLTCYAVALIWRCCCLRCWSHLVIIDFPSMLTARQA